MECPKIRPQVGNEEDIPAELYQEIKAGGCVLFTGASVTTEGIATFGSTTLYEDLNKRVMPREEGLPFPDLMQRFCKQVDGGRKNRLIRKIISRIEAFSTGEHYRMATMFYHEALLIPYFMVFVTTNWDPFLEREANILVPMVENRDIPFWDDKKRQVLKIHGDITRPYTMVITRDDYFRVLHETSREAVFTKLQDLMATRTFLFVGYSMRDSDLQAIYDTLLENLGEFSRLSYVLDPNPTPGSTEQWASVTFLLMRG